MTEQIKTRPDAIEADAQADGTAHDGGDTQADGSKTEAVTGSDALQPGTSASEAIDRATASVGQDDGKR